MRTFFSNSQLEFLSMYPAYRKEIAARALMTMILDMAHLRGTFKQSLKVLIKAKTLPRMADLARLYQFYKISRRSSV
ncbi:hypothetical protein ACLBSV_30295, partial [Klebsiella pneumoniae]